MPDDVNIDYEKDNIVFMCVAHLQALTFNKIAPMALGRIDIKYRRVECKPPQDMNIIVDQNRGAGGWIRLQVKVSNAPLASKKFSLRKLQDRPLHTERYSCSCSPKFAEACACRSCHRMRSG